MLLGAMPLVSAFGCSDPTPTLTQADEDAAAPEGDAQAADALAPCTTPLEGTTPFAARLTSPSVASVDVYFPKGRVANEDAVFAILEGAQRWYTSREALGPDLGAQDVWIGGLAPQYTWISGRLVGPNGGLEADVESRSLEYSQPYFKKHVMLCPSGKPGTTQLTATAKFGPTSTLHFRPTGPLDSATVTPQVLSDGQPIGVQAELASEFGDELRVSPKPGHGFRPGRPISVTWPSLTNVIGEPVTTTIELEPLVTTAVVTDLTFSTSPPVGAITWEGMDGMPADFVFPADGTINVGTFGCDVNHSVVAALPDAAAAQRIRLKAATSGQCPLVRFSVVSADGHAVDIASDEQVDASVEIPGPGPLWLSVYAEEPFCMSPPAPRCDILLDEISFE